MIIKNIAATNGFDSEDFEKWLVKYAGMQAGPGLREYDLQDDRVEEIVQRYAAYASSRQSMKNGVAPPKTARAMGITRIVVGIITIVMSFSLLIEVVKMGSPEYSDGSGSVASVVVLIACFVLLLIGGVVMIVCNKKHVLGGCIACTVLFGIGAIITLTCGWGFDARETLVSTISLSPGSSVSSLLVFYPILLGFSAVGIILSASKNFKYFVMVPAVLILVFAGYTCFTSQQSIIRDGDVFAGLARIADDRYIDVPFVSTGRNKIIAELDGWSVYDIPEDPSHTFLRMKSSSEERYMVKEDYHIPTEGKVNCVYIEGKRFNDKKTLAAFDDILMTKDDAETSYHLSVSAEEKRTWKLVHLGFGDCPVGTDYSIYGITKIDSKWVVIFRGDVGEEDENGYPVTYHEIDPQYYEVFENSGTLK